MDLQDPSRQDVEVVVGGEGHRLRPRRPEADREEGQERRHRLRPRRSDRPRPRRQAGGREPARDPRRGDRPSHRRAGGRARRGRVRRLQGRRRRGRGRAAPAPPRTVPRAGRRPGRGRTHPRRRRRPRPRHRRPRPYERAREAMGLLAPRRDARGRRGGGDRGGAVAAPVGGCRPCGRLSTAPCGTRTAPPGRALLLHGLGSDGTTWWRLASQPGRPRLPGRSRRTCAATARSPTADRPPHRHAGRGRRAARRRAGTSSSVTRSAARSRRTCSHARTSTVGRAVLLDPVLTLAGRRPRAGPLDAARATSAGSTPPPRSPPPTRAGTPRDVERKVLGRGAGHPGRRRPRHRPQRPLGPRPLVPARGARAVHLVAADPAVGRPADARDVRAALSGGDAGDQRDRRRVRDTRSTATTPPPSSLPSIALLEVDRERRRGPTLPDAGRPTSSRSRVAPGRRGHRLLAAGLRVLRLAAARPRAHRSGRSTGVNIWEDEEGGRVRPFGRRRQRDRADGPVVDVALVNPTADDVLREVARPSAATTCPRVSRSREAGRFGRAVDPAARRLTQRRRRQRRPVPAPMAAVPVERVLDPVEVARAAAA